MSTDNNIFCAAPWKHAVVGNSGEYRICCYDKGRSGYDITQYKVDEFLNSDYLKKIKADILVGKKVSNCDVCYEIEALGHESQRSHYNKTMIAPSDVFDVDSSNLQYVELRLGNICNLKCIGCGPTSSVSIAREFVQMGWDKIQRKGILFDERTLSKSYDWSSSLDNYDNLYEIIEQCKRIVLVGGEPFLIPHLSGILSTIDTNKTITIFTNLTMFNSKFIDILSRFDRVEMYYSIDSWGKFNDIARYPSKWDQIWTNFNSYLNHSAKYSNIDTKVFSVVNCISIFKIDQLIRELANMKIKHQLVISTFPNHVRLELLPKDVKENLIEKFKEYPSIVNALRTNKELDTEYELETLRTILKHRNIELPIELEFING